MSEKELIFCSRKVASVFVMPDISWSQIAQNCTKLYKIEQNCTKLYKIAQKCAKLYKIAQNCTKLYMMISLFGFQFQALAIEVAGHRLLWIDEQSLIAALLD